MRIALILPAFLVAAIVVQAQEDAKDLQGVWSVTEFHNAGVAPKAAELKTLKIAVKDNNFVIQLGREQQDRYTFTIDPKKNPKWITLTHSDPKIGTMPGIYEIKADTVTMCFRLTSTIRPKAFQTKPSTLYCYIVMKREKK
jgi:uncharacterized protein (TIGR03067 family)